jgi:alkylation response protein AidB-like acyl-CoA dehydrogenase
MAKSLLGFERIFLGTPRQSEYALGRLRVLADRLSLWDDPEFTDAYVRLAMQLDDLKALFQRFVSILRRGGTIGPDVSMLKIIQTELYQAVTDLMISFAGVHAGRLEPLDRRENLHPASLWIQARASSIYGGSNEIQRNILAKAVLELP